TMRYRRGWPRRPGCRRCTARSRCRWWRCWRGSRPTGSWSMPTNCGARPPTCRGACSPPRTRPPHWPGAASTSNRPSRRRRRSFNLDSPKQLQALLFDELGLPALVKTPKGQPSTNEEALEAIADQHELPRVILEYRGLAKLRSTYTEKLPEMVNPDTGRVHTSYHQAGAATGRLASSDPNLQNIPIRPAAGRRVRRAFAAPAGRGLVPCAYSRIDLRLMAHRSQDEGLLGAFAAGPDIHRATAAEVFGRRLEEVTPEERRAAKAINYGLMYGM